MTHRITFELTGRGGSPARHLTESIYFTTRSSSRRRVVRAGERAAARFAREVYGTGVAAVRTVDGRAVA